PAFVLSQDQTLHKRKFDKAQILAGINFDVQNSVSYLKETFISLTFCCSVFKVHVCFCRFM
ncbi:hypothetical protein, partial [Lysinibacillus composti]|uniref:hypothetical protein n=1 Tax=Lysinibacillus composti TaxID=720633 RepID=UPI001961F66B